MNTVKIKLTEAEKKAAALFKTIEDTQLIVAGKTERELNEEVFKLAKELFGIDKYWHKRIIRCGSNTLYPYDENPPDLTIQNDDILFFDFGPIFEEWEADFGRTYVIGNDFHKNKIKKDIEVAWHEAKSWFDEQTELIGVDFYNYIEALAKKFGWEYGSEIAGHLIGHFPHERLEPGNYNLYVHPQNYTNMLCRNNDETERNWILEIHFIDKGKKIGGFFEQLLT